jgi:hypothetical protein
MENGSHANGFLHADGVCSSVTLPPPPPGRANFAENIVFSKDVTTIAFQR